MNVHYLAKDTMLPISAFYGNKKVVVQEYRGAKGDEGIWCGEGCPPAHSGLGLGRGLCFFELKIASFAAF